MLQTVIAIAIIVVAAVYLVRVYTRKKNKPCDAACGSCNACDNFSPLTHEPPDCCEHKNGASDKS